jgi:hypothetical protein
MKKTSKFERYILLDTCIFGHWDNVELSKQIFSLMEESVGMGYGLCLSNYTIFELLDTATYEEEVKAMNTITGLKQFKMNQSVLIAAGHLGWLYKEDGLDNGKQPESGDKIIGATSVLNNTLIFTTNGRDFPIPFFKVISTPLLRYTKSKKNVYIPSYFLEPNIEVISSLYAERAALQNQKTKEVSPTKKQK